MHIGMYGFGYWNSRSILKAQIQNKYIDKITIYTLSSNPHIGSIPNKHIYFTHNESDILLNNDIKAVIIATPAHTHYDIAKKTLIAGKHILVEKPFTLSYNHAVELLNIAQNIGLSIMIDYTFIYTESINFIKDYLNSNKLNIISNYDSYRLSSINNNLNYSIAWDLAIHDISILYYLGYKYPKTIQAINCSKNENSSDMFINIQYNNIIASIHISNFYPEKIRTIYFLGNNKVIKYCDNTQDKLIIYDKSDCSVTKPILSNTDAVCNMLNYFVNCVKKNIKITDNDAILTPVKILELINKSLNNRDIRLSLF